MADKLVNRFEVRLPLLQQAASTLDTELSALLKDAGIDAYITFAVMNASDFLLVANSATEQNTEPLVEISSQIQGRISVADNSDIQQAEQAIRDELTVVLHEWIESDGYPLPRLLLVCLIPPYAQPQGWSARTDVPRSFEVTIEVAIPLEQNDDGNVIRLSTNTEYALVMKGGGIKGLAYVGALELLETRYEFRWFVGTSAGAIAAILLAAGYSVSELKDILQEKNFKDFFDAKFYQVPFNLIFHKGMHRADAFTHWLDTLLARKLKSPGRVKLSELPNRVTVYASRREKRALRFDSYDNDADAAFAARCSMSIPWVFTPQSDQGFRAYDGGIQYNYPLDELLREHPDTPFVSLYLGSEIYEPEKQRSVLADLISITTEGSDPEAIKKYREQTVIIDPRPIGTLDFDLTEDEKALLLSTGRVGAIYHLMPDSDDLVAVTKERDELKARVTSARASKSWRRFWLRFSILTLLFLLIGFAVWWMWLRPVDTTIPIVLSSVGVENAAWNASEFDVRMPGILIHRRIVDIDLSQEVRVAPEQRDTERISPSVHTYAIHGERILDSAKYVVYEFASQRKQMDVNCFSDHPHVVWFRQDALPLGEGFKNVWTLVVDVSQHSRDIPFTVKCRVTRWNAYQAENKNFVGHLVTANEEEVYSTVELPTGYRLVDSAENPRLIEKQQGNPDAKWEPFSGDAEVELNPSRTGFEWTLRKPRAGFAYAAEIDWTVP